MSEVSSEASVVRQIGTVTILRDRLYHENIQVPAGTYPVIRGGDTIYWTMVGYPCRRQEAWFEKIEDGMFLVHPPRDVLLSTEIEQVESKKFTVHEFEDFLAIDVACLEGPDRRLVFSLFDSACDNSL